MRKTNCFGKTSLVPHVHELERDIIIITTFNRHCTYVLQGSLPSALRRSHIKAQSLDSSLAKDHCGPAKTCLFLKASAGLLNAKFTSFMVQVRSICEIQLSPYQGFPLR